MNDLDRDARQEIADVLVRYATASTPRLGPFRTCFTPDCLAEYADIGTWEGVDAITGFMTESHAGMGHTMHRITNQAITAQVNGATARSYVDAVLMAADGQSGINAFGFYDDRLVRTDEGWRIAHRSYTMVRFSLLGEPA